MKKEYEVTMIVKCEEGGQKHIAQSVCDGLEHWEEHEDSENIEWYLADIKGHNLSNCDWMTHKNPQIITN